MAAQVLAACDRGRDGRAPADLPSDERAIYDLVCRRLLAAWHSDHRYAVTTVITAIACDEARDRYTSQGTSIESMGWKGGRPSPRLALVSLV